MTAEIYIAGRSPTIWFCNSNEMRYIIRTLSALGDLRLSSSRWSVTCLLKTNQLVIYCLSALLTLMLNHRKHFTASFREQKVNDWRYTHRLYCAIVPVSFFNLFWNDEILNTKERAFLTALEVRLLEQVTERSSITEVCPWLLATQARTWPAAVQAEKKGAPAEA